MSNILKFSLLSTVLLFNNCYSTEEDYKLPYEVEPQYYNNNPNINQSTEQSYNNNFNIKQNDSSTPEIANENNPEIEKSMLKQDELSIPPGFKMDDITYFKSINSQILKNLCDKNLTKIMNEDILNKDKFFNKLDAAINLLKKLLDDYGTVYPHLGLENIGATCFMNCTLQLFASFPDLVLEVLEKVKEKYYDLFRNKDGIVTLEFANVMAELFSKINLDGKAYYSPYSFRRIINNLNPIFKDGQAGDANSVFQFLQESLHKALNDYNGENVYNGSASDYSIAFDKGSKQFKSIYRSIISNYMYMLRTTKMTCQNPNCTMPIRYDTDVTTFLNFPLEEALVLRNNKFSNLTGKSVSLEDCFANYEKNNLFQGNNRIYCDNCKKLTNAINQTKLEYGSKILPIILYKDKYSQVDVSIDDIPEYIDVSEFTNQDLPDEKYYLAAVVCHIGENSGAGHFITFSRGGPYASWYKYNDAFVKSVKDEEVEKCLHGKDNKSKVYIAIYRKIKNYKQMVKLENKYQKTPKFGKNTNNNNNTNQNFNNINNNAYTNNNYNKNTNNFMGTNMNNGNVMGMYNMSSMYMNNSNAMGVGNMQMGNMNTNNNMNYMTNNNSMGWNNNWNNNMYNNMNYNNQNMSYQNMSNMNNY